MKSFLTISAVVLTTSLLSGQGNRVSIGMEYTPGFSNATSHYSLDKDYGFRLTHNAFVKSSFRLNKKLALSAGMGYMMTR